VVKRDKISRYFRLAREGNESVTPIELILDVVFVLAFSEVTEYMVHEGSWLSLGDAVIILALFWRGWLGFTWLTSAADPRSALVQISIFTAMGAFGVMALTIAPTFGHHAFWNADGRMVYVFVVAYAVIRSIHFGLGRLASRGDELLRTTVDRTAIGGLIAVVLLLWGASVPGVGGYALWALAVVADYSIVFLVSRFGWRNASHQSRATLAAGHFAERYGLIVIIALGETILGAEGAELNTPTLLLALTGVALLATLWGTYFDGTDTAAEHALVRAPVGVEKYTLARWGYSFMHFPLVVGTLLIALGPKAAVAHPNHPFESHIAGAFFGGLALYLISHAAFGYIMLKRLNVAKLAVGLLMAALIPFGIVRPAWESLVLATSIMTVLVAAQRFAGRATPQAVSID
jgi:low temperature requirement protein LtrA